MSRNLFGSRLVYPTRKSIGASFSRPFNTQNKHFALHLPFVDVASGSNMFSRVGNGSGVLGNRMSSLSTNYALKYREKLLKKAQEEGFSSIEELQEAYAKKNKKIDSKLDPVVDAPNKTVASSLSSPVINHKPMGKEESETYFSDEEDSDSSRQISKNIEHKHSSSKNLPPTVKSLDKIVKMELLEDKSADQISEIWTTFHLGKPGVSAVIPSESYRKMLDSSKKNQIFILPLPRGTGVEFYLVQFDFHMVNFTPLAEYQAKQDAARPYLTLTHYTDFIDEKGIVLMRGEIDNDQKNNLTPDLAQLLVLVLQRFYVAPNEERKKLLDTFTNNPSQFNYNQLIESVNSVD
ncbi:Protein ATP11, mitochondrial [Smittium mucronatum]|uniref:Protein ATP11, mitochondrial n=1 Tax=Smittium mucronatum TaxID=133383 RepID=A0A1R0H7X6_9FUNG|nr:Protein ATP11, mitochondrial [Smittium mucronatum]